MNINKNIHSVLGWLEDNIDEKLMEKAKARHAAALSFQALESPVAMVGFPVEGLDRYKYVETRNDKEKLLYNELMTCVEAVVAADDSILSIRSDFGVGTVPSLFGAKDIITDDNTKPWVTHFSIDDIKSVLDKGMPDLENGYGKKVHDVYCYYNEVLDSYPKCKKHIHLCHPDFQGPFDIAHLLMGPAIFYEIYDSPEIVKELLSLTVETYIAFYKKLNPLFTDKFSIGDRSYNCQGRYVWGGNIVLRNDTAVCISEEHYIEFIKPYDERILKEVGGGSIHFCGRADQWTEAMFSTENVRGINPTYVEGKYTFGHDYLELMKPCMDKNNVPVIAYYICDDEFENFDFQKYNTGVTYCLSASGIEEAKRKQEILANCF